MLLLPEDKRGGRCVQRQQERRRGKSVGVRVETSNAGTDKKKKFSYCD